MLVCVLARALQIGTGQDGWVTAARLVDVNVLGLAREQLIYRGVVQRGGARSVTVLVGLHLRERVLDLLAVIVAFPLLLVAAAVFSVGFPASWAQVPGWMWAR